MDDQFTCMMEFVGDNGKTYSPGDIIYSDEYYELPFYEQKYFTDKDISTTLF